MGSILAIIGAVCNCSPKCQYKFYGFATWVVSNGTLLVWSVVVQAWWLALMYCVFMFTSIYGAVKHRHA
ncbi:MAG: hypothetical protein PHC39_04995 [Proteiniphilum sp.]|nr:hypothetical protein [Proteiniphilum sp.]